LGLRHKQVLIVFTCNETRFKKIGILGGMGPEATAELYLQVIKLFQKKFAAKYDSDYPEITIYNLPLLDVVEQLGGEVKTRDMLVNGVKKLAEAGVDFIAIPCNTVEYCLPEMRKVVSIPIISILEEVDKLVRRNGFIRLGVLSTKMTIAKGLYGRALKKVVLITPTPVQQDRITKIILNVMSGKKDYLDRAFLRKIIKRLKDKGAEKVILGCTELPLIIQRNADTIDTIEILAQAIVEKSIKVQENFNKGSNISLQRGI